MKASTINVDELIKDYTINGMGVEPLCKKYHTGKYRIKMLLKANGVEMKKRGKQPLEEHFIVDDYHTPKYAPHEGYHYEVIDESTGFKTTDYLNLGGHVTTYIEKQYGIKTPTLYDRRMYYMRTGDYWWEQWVKTIEVKDADVKVCPYCGWTTKDVENRSGQFEVHLFSKHGITKRRYLQEHPEDRDYFKLVNRVLDLQMETDEEKFVVCKVCGKKLRRITDVHLAKHGLTKAEYIQKYNTPTVSKVLHETMSQVAIKNNEERMPTFSSQPEKELKEFITNLGFENETNRRILHGRELDIYIPSMHIAIEFNGNLWHSESNGKMSDYHLNKLEECNKNGIQLIQIFEDEYMLHKDIVFSKLKHLLHKEYGGRKVFGRNVEVKPILKHDAEIFLNLNHIQGFVSGTVYLGAFLDNELVAVMIFVKTDSTMWNLSRYASKLGYVCSGVGGKLFKFFVGHYNPLTIISFADRRWTIRSDDNLYTKLGFRLDSVLKPDYHYYNPSVDRYRRLHKFGFRKQTLAKKYNLPLDMTEKEMTEKLGYTKIWDCGLFKYIWSKPLESHD